MAPSDAPLQGWKEVATALDVGVRTAQRWERDAGLPVHRILRSHKAPVFAIRSEVDAWQARQTAAEPHPRQAGRTGPARPRPDGVSPLARGWHQITRMALGRFLGPR